MPALATVPTALGPFTALVDDEGAVLASGWTDDADALLALVHPELRPSDPARAYGARRRHRRGRGVPRRRPRARDVDTRAAAGRAGHIGDLGAAAGRAGRARRPPTASWPPPRATRSGHRIAARACVTNAATLFVPCHRVLRRGGALGGYRWGLELKERLLALEASWRVDDAALSGV